MAKFKVIVSDPEGTSKVVELEENRAVPLIGRKIGEIIDGSVVNIPGQKIQVTGGSDKDGFPMRPSVHGGVRRRVLLSGGVGFNSQKKGMQKRKTIRGNVITDEIVQINLKIVEKAKKQQEEDTKVKQRKKKQTKKEDEEGAPKEAQPQNKGS